MTDQTTQETTPKCAWCRAVLRETAYGVAGVPGMFCSGGCFTAALSALPTPTVEGSGSRESEAARDSERLTLMEQWATASAEASGYSEHAAEVEAWNVPQDDDDPCREWSVSGPRCKGYTIMGKGSSLREAIDDAQKRGREEGAVNAEVDRG